MKKRLFSSVVLTIVLCLPLLAAGQNQLDIALEGPWILFSYSMTNASNKSVPVLVAVAPVGATKATAVHPKSHFHHWPQISSGNGFYLPPYGIFCLAFDTQCAPSAGVSPTLIKDPGYPSEDILQLKPHGTPKQWLPYGSNNVVVILPMPDYYHADGVWRMEFLSDRVSLDHPSVPDTGYPIGLILHYAKDPKRLQLYSCTSSPSTVPQDCPNDSDAQDLHHHPIEVTNTGTVRLQMRAPDTTDICDHHARFAFHQMLKLLDPNYANAGHALYPQYRYIEPAQGMDPKDLKDNGIFETSKGKHPCFDGDESDQEAPHTGMPQPADTTQDPPDPPAYPFTEALKTIDEQWDSTEPLLNILDKKPLFEAKKDFEAARTDFKEANELGGSLLISDVNRMGALLEQSAHEIRIGIAELHLESVRSESLNYNDEIDAVAKLQKLSKAMTVFADDTKNGADCRAPQVLVQ